MKLFVALLLVAAATGFAVTRGHPAAAISHQRTAAKWAWPPLTTARGFFLTQLDLKLQRHWGKAWEALYPLHRRIVRRTAYVRCESANPFPADFERLRVLSVRRVPVHVAGLTHTVPGVALRTRIALGWYGSRDPIRFTHTFHLVPVHGSWTWLLSPERYRLYLRDGCGLNPAA